MNSIKTKILAATHYVTIRIYSDEHTIKTTNGFCTSYGSSDYRDYFIHINLY